MSVIRINEMRNSAILRIYSERNSIQANPDYQRMGGIWTLDSRQLLIDTILNDLDMPKIYLHELNEPRITNGRLVRYAIIDGRQRLETIWTFIDGAFALADDFEFFENPAIKAGGMTYGDLAAKYPMLKTRLDSHTLPVFTVITDDMDMIEDMFSRLNDASPLNAAEKRNAFGGPLAQVIRDVSTHSFFTTNIPFSNKRYQHLEVAAKCLLLSEETHDVPRGKDAERFPDTKKVYLDEFVKSYKRDNKTTEAGTLREKVRTVLDKMAQLFTKEDPLLKTQAMTIIYYLIIKEALAKDWLSKVTRKKLLSFDEEREANRSAAAEDIAKAKYDLLEFDRMHLQGSNDAASIKFRFETLRGFLAGYSE